MKSSNKPKSFVSDVLSQLVENVSKGTNQEAAIFIMKNYGEIEKSISDHYDIYKTFIDFYEKQREFKGIEEKFKEGIIENLLQGYRIDLQYVLTRDTTTPVNFTPIYNIEKDKNQDSISKKISAAFCVSYENSSKPIREFTKSRSNSVRANLEVNRKKSVYLSFQSGVIPTLVSQILPQSFGMKVSDIREDVCGRAISEYLEKSVLEAIRENLKVQIKEGQLAEEVSISGSDAQKCLKRVLRTKKVIEGIAGKPCIKRPDRWEKAVKDTETEIELYTKQKAESEKQQPTLQSEVLNEELKEKVEKVTEHRGTVAPLATTSVFPPKNVKVLVYEEDRNDIPIQPKSREAYYIELISKRAPEEQFIIEYYDSSNSRGQKIRTFEFFKNNNGRKGEPLDLGTCIDEKDFPKRLESLIKEEESKLPQQPERKPAQLQDELKSEVKTVVPVTNPEAIKRKKEEEQKREKQIKEGVQEDLAREAKYEFLEKIRQRKQIEAVATQDFSHLAGTKKPNQPVKGMQVGQKSAYRGNELEGNSKSVMDALNREIKEKPALRKTGNNSGSEKKVQTDDRGVNPDILKSVKLKKTVTNGDRSAPILKAQIEGERPLKMDAAPLKQPNLTNPEPVNKEAVKVVKEEGSWGRTNSMLNNALTRGSVKEGEKQATRTHVKDIFPQQEEKKVTQPPVIKTTQVVLSPKKVSASLITTEEATITPALEKGEVKKGTAQVVTPRKIETAHPVQRKAPTKGTVVSDPRGGEPGNEVNNVSMVEKTQKELLSKVGKTASSSNLGETTIGKIDFSKLNFGKQATPEDYKNSIKEKRENIEKSKSNPSSPTLSRRGSWELK